MNQEYYTLEEVLTKPVRDMTTVEIQDAIKKIDGMNAHSRLFNSESRIVLVMELNSRMRKNRLDEDEYHKKMDELLEMVIGGKNK